jgi:hypothetical protein
VPSATKLWNRRRKADAEFLGATVGWFKPVFDHGVVPEEVLDSFVVDRGKTFLAGIRLLQQFEHESLAKSAMETVHRLNLFGVNLGLHECQGEHGKQWQRKTAKDCPLVWDTGASFYIDLNWMAKPSSCRAYHTIYHRPRLDFSVHKHIILSMEATVL